MTLRDPATDRIIHSAARIPIDDATRSPVTLRTSHDPRAGRTVMKSLLIPWALLTAPATAENWQYFAVVSDGRYLSDDNSLRLVGTIENQDLSVDVQVKNFDSGARFRVAIGVVDCLRYGNGPLLLFTSDAQPQQLTWTVKGHRWLDLAGAKLCDWAKTQATLVD